MQTCTPEQAGKVFARALPVVPLKLPVCGLPGKPDARDAAATLESIELGVDLIREKRASALVTNPISKAALYEAGFAHPGHTEFLGALARLKFGVEARPVMLLWSPELAVVPVTIHVALAQVPKLLTTALIVETASIVAQGLVRHFGITRPRLAFAAQANSRVEWVRQPSGVVTHRADHRLLYAFRSHGFPPASLSLVSLGFAFTRLLFRAVFSPACERRFLRARGLCGRAFTGSPALCAHLFVRHASMRVHPLAR